MAREPGDGAREGQAGSLHREVIEAARAGEPDRYVAALLAPAAARPGLIALAAFSGELRRIPRVVREPMMGEVRLQWWRDVLAAASTPSADPIGHPLADAITATVSRYRLPLTVLLAMTEARAFDLYRDPMPDRATFDAYLVKLEGALAELTLRILAANRDAPDGDALAIANRAGCAYGQARLLYDLADMLQRGASPLPADLCASTGGIRDHRDEGPGGSMAQCVETLADEAEQRTLQVWRAASYWPRPWRVGILPLAMVRPYARAARQMAGDDFRVRREIIPLDRMWRLTRAHLIGL